MKRLCRKKSQVRRCALREGHRGKCRARRIYASSVELEIGGKRYPMNGVAELAYGKKVELEVTAHPMLPTSAEDERVVDRLLARRREESAEHEHDLEYIAMEKVGPKWRLYYRCADRTCEERWTVERTSWAEVEADRAGEK